MTEKRLPPRLREELIAIYSSLLRIQQLQEQSRSARIARRGIKTLLLMIEADDAPSLVCMGFLPESREVSA